MTGGRTATGLPAATRASAAGPPATRADAAAGSKAPAGGAVLAAAQAALAAEHVAVYGYGLAGPRLTGDRKAAALAAYNAHRDQRDRMAELVRGLGGTPVAAAPAYTAPFPVDGPTAAARLAVRLEEAAASAYADLVAAGTGKLRAAAGLALQDAAVRAARWRTRPVAFPGLAEVTPG